MQDCCCERGANGGKEGRLEDETVSDHNSAPQHCAGQSPTCVVQDEKVRPLTKDQKLGNAIFLRLLKEAWNDARKQLEVGVPLLPPRSALLICPYLMG